MAIEVTLEGTLENEKDFEGYIKLIQELAKQWQLKMESLDDYAYIEVCPEGYIEITHENLYLSISAQTNVAGAGFHAYVCDFFKALQDKSPLPLTANDPSGYYEQRNFNHLKYGIFHRWLADIAAYVKEHEEEIDQLCISWPLDYYRPKCKQGHMVTPLGYIAKNEFYEADIEALADRFFIWNHIGRDACYYRNAALNLLWKECYFEYSNMNEDTKKQADTILDYLELAYQKDASLPLPIQEYEYLCKIRAREAKIQDAVRMNPQQEIGYRRNLVEYHYGNWCIIADGCCEKSMDTIHDICYFMSPYHNEEEPWQWMIRLHQNEKEVDLRECREAWSGLGELVEWTYHDVQGAAVIIRNEDHTVAEAVLKWKAISLSVQYLMIDESHLSELLTHMKTITYQHQGKEMHQA